MLVIIKCALQTMASSSCFLPSGASLGRVEDSSPEQLLIPPSLRLNSQISRHLIQTRRIQGAFDTTRPVLPSSLLVLYRFPARIASCRHHFPQPSAWTQEKRKFIPNTPTTRQTSE
ncbi:hypothetical protein LZ32DRAFT_226336 [Colletotrichum eremochloae]|nr:hypothetical protein LZ32DRAFT_226336 [Colletotrichum eremochloae]